MTIHTFIAHMGLGGAERVCVNLANEWAKRGHEVHIVVLNLDNDINTKDLAGNVQVHTLGVSRLRYAALPILKYIKKYKPKFLFVFGNEMAVILNKLRKLKLHSTPLIVRVLNNVNISLAKEDNVSPAVEAYLNRAQKEMKYYEGVVAQCEAMGNQLLEKGLVDEKQLSVIYNPVSESLLQKVEEKRCEAFPIETKDKDNYANLCETAEIAFIGRIDPQKNPTHLIEAFSILHEKMPNVRLRMVGSGNLDNEIKKMVADKGLTDYVIFDGIRNDMENIYSKADVVALSSDYEGMPNCLIEAIGCGIPVVSYDCPLGPSEIIVQGINGYLVPLHNIVALADRLQAAIEKKWDREEIISTCDKFRVAKAATKYEEIFKKY